MRGDGGGGGAGAGASGGTYDFELILEPVRPPGR